MIPYPAAVAASASAKDFRFVSSSNANGTTTSHTVTAPTDIQVGDLLLVCGHRTAGNISTATLTLSGWTVLAPLTTTGNFVTRYLWKIADASDVAASSFTFTWANASGSGQIAILVYRGAASVSAGNSNDANAATSLTLPTLTLTSTPAILVGVWVRNGSSTVSASPSGMTIRTALTMASNGMHVFDQPALTSPTGTRVCTFTTSANSGGVLIGVYPAP